MEIWDKKTREGDAYAANQLKEHRQTKPKSAQEVEGELCEKINRYKSVLEDVKAQFQKAIDDSQLIESL